MLGRIAIEVTWHLVIQKTSLNGYLKHQGACKIGLNSYVFFIIRMGIGSARTKLASLPDWAEEKGAPVTGDNNDSNELDSIGISLYIFYMAES